MVIRALPFYRGICLGCGEGITVNAYEVHPGLARTGGPVLVPTRSVSNLTINWGNVKERGCLD